MARSPRDIAFAFQPVTQQRRVTVNATPTSLFGRNQDRIAAVITPGLPFAGSIGLTRDPAAVLAESHFLSTTEWTWLRHAEIGQLVCEEWFAIGSIGGLEVVVTEIFFRPGQ